MNLMILVSTRWKEEGSIPKQYYSEIAEETRMDIEGLYELGIVDQKTMRHFDDVYRPRPAHERRGNP